MEQDRIVYQKTQLKDGLNKIEMIKAVREYCKEHRPDYNMTYEKIEFILDAFSRIAREEQIIRGVFRFPGLPKVKRSMRKPQPMYLRHIEKSIICPEIPYLRATVEDEISQIHRKVQREQRNLVNNTNSENWFDPYIICDGDYKEKIKTDKDLDRKIKDVLNDYKTDEQLQEKIKEVFK